MKQLTYFNCVKSYLINKKKKLMLMIQKLYKKIKKMKFKYKKYNKHKKNNNHNKVKMIVLLNNLIHLLIKVL